MMKTIIILSANNVHSANQKEGSENGDVLCSTIFLPRKKILGGWINLSEAISSSLLGSALSVEGIGEDRWARQ